MVGGSLQQFLIGSLAYLVGFDFRDAVIASTLSRVIEVTVILVLGGIYTFQLSRRMISRCDE